MRPGRKKPEDVAAECIEAGEDLKDFVIEHIPPKERQVAVVDPSWKTPENKFGHDLVDPPSDDESIVLSSGSSCVPSGQSGEELPEPEPEVLQSPECYDVNDENDSEAEPVAEPEPPACTGSKPRWSKQEESALREAFDIQIKQKKNVSTVEIREAKKCYPVLQDRSEAVIRTKINNIKLGKYKKKC